MIFKNLFKSLLPGGEGRAALGPSVPPKQFGASLPRLESSCYHLPFLDRKKSNFPYETKAIYILISSVCPRTYELFFLGFL